MVVHNMYEASLELAHDLAPHKTKVNESVGL